MTDAVLDEHDIALDQLEYLKTTGNVCANGSTTGWTWVRYHDGDWQALRFATEAVHTSEYVHGEVWDRQRVVDWLVGNPVTMHPQSTAYRWSPDSNTVWDYADEQDAFTDRDRCVWCGHSDRTRSLGEYETVDDGTVTLCEDCRDDWGRAGELVNDGVTA